MKFLANIALKSDSFTNWFNNDYSQLNKFLDKYDLDGIEAILYNPGNLNDIPKNIIKGLHLIYWPMWLDLWLNNEEELYKEFINNKNIIYYYGFNKKEGIINKYIEEFNSAKVLQVEYMVYHVSHISIEETYTRNFKYSNRKVLEETIKLINMVFKGEGPILLFENLWSSGLNLLDYDLTKWFIESINYLNKGIILDISHLLITNPSIKTYDEAILYIKKVLYNLKDLKKYIKGIHLNKSCFDNYIREDHNKKVINSNSNSDFTCKLVNVYKHVSKIDTHLPFENYDIKKIIDDLSPNWVVYEFLPKNFNDWKQKISIQNKYLMR